MTIFASQDYERHSGAHAAARESSAVFSAVATLVRERVGYSQLTMLRLEVDGEHMTRIFTTNERHYPLAAAEALGSTASGDHVLPQGRPFLGGDKVGFDGRFLATMTSSNVSGWPVRSTCRS